MLSVYMLFQPRAFQQMAFFPTAIPSQFHNYLTAWHMIQWLQQHEEYTNAAVSVAEYATKTALFRYLPHDTAAHYTHLMALMGLDVDAVSATSLGEYALEMAVPAMAEYYSANYSHHHRRHDDQSAKSDQINANIKTPAAFLAGNAATNIINHIISQIRDIAGMSLNNEAGHRKMAEFIRNAKSHANSITASAFKEAAFSAYGKGAHWLALALPQLEHDGKLLIVSEINVIENELKQSYEYWVKWAKSIEPDIKKMQDDGADFLQDLENGCTNFFHMHSEAAHANNNGPSSYHSPVIAAPHDATTDNNCAALHLPNNNNDRPGVGLYAAHQDASKTHCI
jgi:hypothetical protein